MCCNDAVAPTAKLAAAAPPSIPFLQIFKEPVLFFGGLDRWMDRRRISYASSQRDRLTIAIVFWALNASAFSCFLGEEETGGKKGEGYAYYSTEYTRQSIRS